MANAFEIAAAHLDAGLREAEANNIDLPAYGQALLWTKTFYCRIPSR
ncbi:MAG: hypothetical protein U5O39_13150 [Gammaproteobacteria bacterium]|nr:hypothetical protein [Gammaproteobacteria bacterium]